MQYHRSCLVFGVFSLMSIVAGCEDGVDRSLLSADAPPSQHLVADGSNPYGVIQGRDGNFYGTTSNGGQFNQGTVFRLTPGGIETVLYSFAGGNDDGSNPTGNLIQGRDGNFYGATGSGGPGECPDVEPVGYSGPPSTCGTLFKLTPDGMETVLHFFSGGADGGLPTGSLVQGSDGNFYGTTSFGSGTVFVITPEGEETVLHSFPNGSIPSSLILGSDGNFYGTTFIGGGSDDGTVFRITPVGAGTVLYSFRGGGDGELPSAPLVEGSDGTFYGTTAFGGSEDAGTIFRVTASGEESILYAFPGSDNVANPYGPLVQGSDGNFYGATSRGGQFDGGTVFQITPDGVLTVLHSFAGAQNSQ